MIAKQQKSYLVPVSHIVLVGGVPGALVGGWIGYAASDDE